MIIEETTLTKIIKYKHDWIKLRKKKQPLINFRHKINKITRDFYHSLTIEKPFFILECKKKSPSLGIIRNDFNLIEIANIYKKYASSISVVTDEKYFNGNLEFINIVRECVSQPILCKDFFIDPYQVYLARYYNADAILLMLSVLDDIRYKELSEIANGLNMGILTEVNNILELKRALKLNANIIGINNRNLHDLSIDFNRTCTLSPLIKKNVIVISESGIKKYRHIKKLSKFVNGFLIGSHLMSKKDLDVSIRSLIMGKNKVCGLTRTIDTKIVEQSGSIYGGLIFAKHSPRYITKTIAKKIIINSNLKYIGIFQDEDINILSNISEELSLYAVQLHGHESQKYINQLRKQLSKNIQIWKAFPIKLKLPILNWKHINKYVFDSCFGGSNQSFDWSILDDHILDNVILAGGINLKNVTLASNLNCSGLDLNSGVETSPGIKDHKKIELIFKNLRYY